MTKQTKHFIDVSDIIGLRLECSHCRATVSISIPSEIRADSFRSCPNCKEPWANLPGGSTIELDIKKFADGLKTFDDLLRRRQEAVGGGFVLSLEVKGDAVPQAEAVLVRKP